MPRGVKGSGPYSKAPRKPADAITAQPVVTPPAAVSAQERFPANKPLGSVDVASLSGEDLRIYARRAGVSARDVENLTEDRLRQNTKLSIVNHFELLSEA